MVNPIDATDRVLAVVIPAHNEEKTIATVLKG